MKKPSLKLISKEKYPLLIYYSDGRARFFPNNKDKTEPICYDFFNHDDAFNCAHGTYEKRKRKEK